MTTYWQSQPRHFCEFCKCWIADNKPSRDFHERGKNHIANVEEKIKAVQKKATKQAIEDAKTEDAMAKMEREALAAFKEDLASDPALAAQYAERARRKKEAEERVEAAKRAQKEAKLAELRAHRELLSLDKPKQHSDTKPNDVVNEKKRKASKCDSSGGVASSGCPDPYTSEDSDVNELDEDCPWAEALSPEGYTYYWHRDTAEVTWVKPASYRPQSFKDTMLPDSESLVSNPGISSSVGEPVISSRVFESSTTTKPCSTSDAGGDANEGTLLDNAIISDFGPQPKPDPYGSWQAIEEDKEPALDLELPTVPVADSAHIKVIPLQQARLKIKEKQAPPLGSDLVSFKKRNVKKFKTFNFREKPVD